MDSLNKTYRPLRKHYKNLCKWETTPQMTLLMLRKAPIRDGLPASATKLIGRTLVTLVSKLETANIENKPKKA